MLVFSTYISLILEASSKESKYGNVHRLKIVWKFKSSLLAKDNRLYLSLATLDQVYVMWRYYIVQYLIKSLAVYMERTR